MTLAGKTVLVTGGTGSLGQVLVRRLLSDESEEIKKVIVLSRDEGKQHQMRMSYMNRQVTTDEVIYKNFQRALEFRIGDVFRYEDVCSAVKDADIVVNAAALKQVPLCEYFPDQALKTNCLGALNIVRAIREHDFPVETVVGVSTDKAAKPINVMGMTKALQERIFLSANIVNPKTRFVCVRYGNVLASRGSVIPLFHEQIRTGGPVTITVPSMTRFLLSLNQAVDTVVAAIQSARRGEIFVPRVPSARVIDVAEALIGGRDIEVNVIGIRPGEKMHEILVSEEESIYTTSRGQYLAIGSMLPELCDGGPDAERALEKEYSSGDSVITREKTEKLLKENRLMLDDSDLNSGSELLR